MLCLEDLTNIMVLCD